MKSRTSASRTQPPTHTDPPGVDLVPDLLPRRGLCLLAGSPNLGKTALLASTLRQLRDGEPIFGRVASLVPPIGIVSVDRRWGRGAGEWFKRAGYPEIPHYALADDRALDTRPLRRRADRVAVLGEYIDRLRLPPGGLVCVDPLSLFLGGQLLDYDACTVACCEIRQLLQRRDLTLLGTVHTVKLRGDVKQRYTRPQDAILGSTAIAGSADTLLCLQGPEETGEASYTLTIVSHTAPVETIHLERNELGLFVPCEAPRDPRKAACDLVLSVLPADHTPMTAGVILAAIEALAQAAAAELGVTAVAPAITRRTLFRVLRQLQADGRIVKEAGGYRRPYPS